MRVCVCCESECNWKCECEYMCVHTHAYESTSESHSCTHTHVYTYTCTHTHTQHNIQLKTLRHNPSAHIVYTHTSSLLTLSPEAGSDGTLRPEFCDSVGRMASILSSLTWDVTVFVGMPLSPFANPRCNWFTVTEKGGQCYVDDVRMYQLQSWLYLL